MLFPFTIGIGLVGGGRAIQHRWSFESRRIFARWLGIGVLFGLAISQWFFLIVSLDGTPTGDPVAMNANSVASGVMFTSIVGYFCVKTKRRVRELQQANERLDDFASIVSHDLRNPLNVVQGHLPLARETGDASHFDAIEEATDRMDQLVNEVLTLARTSESHPAKRSTVDLSLVATQAASTVETGAVEVVVETDAQVEANPERLRTLFENLFRNAVVHGAPEITTIRVSTSAVGFVVEDDGVGVPLEERERIFEGGFSTEEQGTGFGLPIVRQIAESHGWTISVRESETGGARFEFAAPVAAAPAA
ncbi:sensor histidine kinase [Haloarchaeobius sp. DFWS5]|uniref:sensor histidine kinase n=1 Tax=Haloarchaeobius sp. DFWS5 TaxID=3446114 RepID=UPI003EBA5F88